MDVLRRLVKGAALTLMLGAMGAAAVPGVAAPLPRQGGLPPGQANADARPYNLDAPPCDGAPGQSRGDGQGSRRACGEASGSPQGAHAPRHPGSSAFGLQFNSEYN